jgi:tetratricopeptide (TPR) repeat protein
VVKSCRCPQNSQKPLPRSLQPSSRPLYRALGADSDARENYEHALRLNSGQDNAYLGLGQLLEKQNKLAEAISNYSRAVELRPTDRGFLFLGHALANAGHRAEALAAYQQALKISPDLVEAQHAVDQLAAKPN